MALQNKFNPLAAHRVLYIDVHDENVITYLNCLITRLIIWEVVV